MDTWAEEFFAVCECRGGAEYFASDKGCWGLWVGKLQKWVKAIFWRSFETVCLDGVNMYDGAADIVSTRTDLNCEEINPKFDIIFIKIQKIRLIKRQI